MTRIRRRRQAFSLLEILLALFTIGIAVAAFVPSSLSTRRLLAHNRRKELAVEVAGALIDQARNLGYAKLSAGNLTLPTVPQQPDLPNFTYAANISLLDSHLHPTSTDLGRKRIDVTVSWDDKLKDKGSVTASSVVAND